MVVPGLESTRWLVSVESELPSAGEGAQCCTVLFEVPVAMLSSSSTALQTAFFMGRVKLASGLGNPEIQNGRSYLKTLWSGGKVVHTTGCLYYHNGSLLIAISLF